MENKWNKIQWGQVALRRAALENYMLGAGGGEKERLGRVEGGRRVPLVKHT